MKDAVEPRADQRRPEPWEWAGARRFGAVHFLGATFFIVLGVVSTAYGIFGDPRRNSPITWIAAGLLCTGYFGWVMYRGVRSWLR